MGKYCLVTVQGQMGRGACLRTRSGDVSGRRHAAAHVANNVGSSCSWLEAEQKMTAEEVKEAGVEASKRPPGSGRHPGGTLHQTRALPFSFTTIALSGFVLSAAIGYFVLYAHKKPDATASDVAKVTIGVADPNDTRPSPSK